MKVFLMHRDRDAAIKEELLDTVFDAMLTGNPYALRNLRRDLERAGKSGEATGPARPGTDDILTQDLELDTLWHAMAGDDEFLFETARRVMLSPLQDPQDIVYRQRVLADTLEHPDVVQGLNELAMEALENERKAGTRFSSNETPESILHWSVSVLTLHLDVLHRLRTIADEESGGFRSPGFTRFFDMVRHELDDDYLHLLEQHLRELTFNRGILESAGLGAGDKGRDYLVHRQPEQRWTERIGLGRRTPGYTFTIAERDEAGFHALAEIRARGLNQIADAVAQAAEHIKSFFTMLRLELAFYLGALNLHERLTQKGEPTCFPDPVAADSNALSARGLYDVGLTLTIDDLAIGNDIDADAKRLVVITGANQGGKSTTLRSLGTAHLMMQAGLFVAGQSFRASIRTGVFTHHKREEDATMTSGKLDEELRRMSQIADQITPHSLLLCNESFASTNEREGSEIARHVIRAMLDNDITVVLVTHMYDLAHHLHDQRPDDALFLRAERQPDGRHTYKVLPGEPLPTSYGRDSYRRVFGVTDSDAPTLNAHGTDEAGWRGAQAFGWRTLLTGTPTAHGSSPCAQHATPAAGGR